MGNEVKVKSLQKALEVLNCFTEKQPLSVKEISEKLGLYKSNVHNILSTFVAMDYLRQDAETEKYSLGSSILSLIHAAGDSYDVHAVAAPYMDELANRFGETVYLSIPCKFEIIYLDTSIPGPMYVFAQNLRGERAPMHATAGGKVMLSMMPDDVLEEMLRQPLEKCTENTITDPEKMRKEIEAVRKKGYATDNMELAVGITCVSVALTDNKGKVHGAMSVSGPSPRFDDKRIDEIQAAIKESAAHIRGFL